MQASYQGYQAVYPASYGPQAYGGNPYAQQGQYPSGPDVMPAAYHQGCGPEGGGGAGCHPGGGCGPQGCSSGCGQQCGSGCGKRCSGCCDPCCNDCAACGDCGCFNPLLGVFSCGWRVRGEGVLLHRTLADQVAYAFVNDPTAPVLSNNNLDFDYEWSFRVAAERRLHDDHSLEVQYMGFWNWSNGVRFNDAAGNIQSFYNVNGAPITGFANATTQEIAYSSEFDSAEINHWVPVKCSCLGSWNLSTCLGARYVRISEDFQILSFAPGGTGSSSIGTQNDLIGGHFGWLVTAPINCNWALRWGGRAGVFGNIIQSGTSVDSNVGGVNTRLLDESDRKGDVAFVGGTDVQLAYRVNCGLSLTVGTEFLWVDGVALAAEQFNPNIGAARVPFTNDNGLAFYQGFSFGLEYVW